MTWVKVDDAFPSHPKVVGLSDAAIATWLRGVCYSSQNLTDGFIPEAALRLVGNRKAAAALVGAGLWAETVDGWRIHEYEQHQRSREQVQRERELARQRSAVRRAKSDGSSRELRAKTAVSSRDVTLPEKSREEKNPPGDDTPATPPFVARYAARYSEGHQGADPPRAWRAAAGAAVKRALADGVDEETIGLALERAADENKAPGVLANLIADIQANGVAPAPALDDPPYRPAYWDEWVPDGTAKR